MDNIGTGVANVNTAPFGTPSDPILAEHAAEIHRVGQRARQRAVEDMVEIGRHLAQAQEHVGHGHRGAYLAWIETEFGWSDQTARRFIHIYNLSRDPKFNNLLNSELPISGLYQLAAPNSPPEAVKEIAERVESGEKPNAADIKKTIERKKRTASNAEDKVRAREPTATSDSDTTDTKIKTAPKPTVLDVWREATFEQRLEHLGCILESVEVEDFRRILPPHLRRGLESHLINLHGLKRSDQLTKLLRTALRSRAGSAQQITAIGKMSEALAADGLDFDAVAVRVPKSKT